MDIWIAGTIIVALVLGWLLGRNLPARRDTSSVSHLENCSQSYIKGLNYLLANQSDKAIDLFVDLVKVDNETMETHLALGNLFRSKGEVDRAIKIHQNLIARPNLDQAQRIMALSELAEDYQKAGLLDRAENLYKELVQINPADTQSLRKLYEIYSLEKSWQEARDVARVLVDLNEADARLILTHCYCELAQAALDVGNLRDARQQLDYAIQIESRCERALLLMLQVHLRNQDTGKARKLFDQLLQHGVGHVEMLIEPARAIFQQSGTNKQYQAFLHAQYQKTPVGALAVELLENYLAAEQHDELLNFLRSVLEKPVTMEIFDFAMRYFKNFPRHLDQAWSSLSEKFVELKNRQVAYTCHVCGYGSHAHYWKCPSCQSWSSMKLVN